MSAAPVAGLLISADRTMTRPRNAQSPAAIPELQVLAAIDRAARHSCATSVPWYRIVEHLGLDRYSRQVRELRETVGGLVAAEALELTRSHGGRRWSLTSKGRRRLSKASRQKDLLQLPEAPQHQKWRLAREKAAKQQRTARRELQRTLQQAHAVLADEHGDSHAWLQLSTRLQHQCARIGWIVYCLQEWAEPTDEQPDIDGHRRRLEYHARPRMDE